MQDAATLNQIIKWLGAMCRHLRMTVVISLLQPPPETFALFDDLILMNEGTIVYQNSVAGAVPFMHGLGFELPARKVRFDAVSFLSCVLSVR